MAHASPPPLPDAFRRGAPQATPARPGRARQSLFAGLCALLMLLFVALGVWQVQRRAWKLGLIAAVDRRVHAAPQPAPPPAAWPGLDASAHEYEHVQVSGRLLDDRAVLVQALTELGGGFWVLTPLRTPAGWIVLVNRGFVPPERAAAARAGTGAPGPASVTGLLRASEPGGAFLQSNDPAQDRWVSRDVAAIAAARGLGPVAPYFIDADATPNPGGYPVGGLTVIAFHNSHLVYAFTWFGLAGLSGFGVVRVLRGERAARTPASRP